MVQEVINAITLGILGHLSGALGFYFNHRFVMHGKLGKLFLLKRIKRLHAIHHAHPYDQLRNQYLIIPIWGKILMALLIGVLSLLSFFYAMGVLSFFLLYGYRHYRIHNQDRKSHFYYHHHYHHKYDFSYNYSGVYPSIDKIFKTYVQTKFSNK